MLNRALILAAASLAMLPAQATAGSFPDPATDVDRASVKGKQIAVFSGGCFWCTEAVFEQIAGIDKVISGYAGGDKKSAHYEIVSAGKTDHAESIQITFDPARISYGTLLKIFFHVAHDPTQLNRQGPDWGKQYRSAIFFHTPEQEAAAKAAKEQLEKSRRFSKPIVTQIVPAVTFFEAEDYHQQYLEKKGLASCHIKA